MTSSVHISLAGMNPGPERDKLLAIPTGLTLKPSDVDLLVGAGEAAVRDFPGLKGFLSNYPPRPAARFSRLHLAARHE